MTKNIVFDLGGILVGLDSARSIAAFREIGATSVASYIEDHRTEDLFLDIELGRATTAQFCREVRRIARCEATDAQIEQAWDALLTHIPAPKLRAIDQLKDRYRLFLLSNTNQMHWNHCQRLALEASGRRLDSYFERCFLSYEMGMAKPSREIFAAMLRMANLNAAETLFIDDTEDNCLSARAMGIDALHDPDGTLWERQLGKQ